VRASACAVKKSTERVLVGLSGDFSPDGLNATVDARSPSAWAHVVGRFAGDKSGITDKLTFSFNF
jgi:hypothetical protein